MCLYFQITKHCIGFSMVRASKIHVLPLKTHSTVLFFTIAMGRAYVDRASTALALNIALFWSCPSYGPPVRVFSLLSPPIPDAANTGRMQVLPSERQSQLTSCLLLLRNATSLQYALVERCSSVILAESCSVRSV